MEFIKILRSIEEFLYEIMSWLIFYPRTMWRVIRRPVQMIAYSEREMKDTYDEQYINTLSPPLFLMLTMLLAHAIELALGEKTIEPSSGIAAKLMDSEQSLLLVRSVLFSIYPLIFAVSLLGQMKVEVTRNSLREPFFSQCYLAAPAALLTSIAVIMLRLEADEAKLAGLFLWICTVIWYVWIQTLWFKGELSISGARAFGLSVSRFAFAGIVAVSLAALIVGAF